ncbi:hypothetical protein RFI_25376 [Reticulomyxa filosa]|uniref:Uncharacterized protein n=1 Tax=Reticulomyxa filosa TaxID=46433 RepID=X6MDP6_RETFI|nr:hypothetical protein RFI_25376 [Reticulomyxa filosa]|eukprot:ETO11999.1 hypothetical protein RFI_25376 [Reticulomyxa filosa]
MVQLLIKTNEYEQARKALTPVLKHYRQSQKKGERSAEEKVEIDVQTVPIPLLCLECHLSCHFEPEMAESTHQRMLAYVSKHPDDFTVNYLAAKYFQAYHNNSTAWVEKTDQLFRHTLQLQNNWAYVWCEFSQFLLQQGDKQTSKQCFETAKQKNPDLPFVQRLKTQFT